MSKFDKKYNMEEKHRGKWQPLMIDAPEGEKPRQKHVFMEEKHADALNIHAERRAIRYVLADGKKDSKKSDDTETPMAKAKRLKEEIAKAETVDAVDALAKDGTPAVIKAADKRKAELTK